MSSGMHRDWDFYEQVTERARQPAPSTVAQATRLGPDAAPARPTACPAPHAAGTPTAAEAYVDPLHRRLREHYARMYPYQRELFRVSALQDSLVYLQTGGGKTWVAAALVALHLATHPTSRVFFVVQTVALAEQQANVLRRLIGIDVACVAGGAREYRTADAFCQSASCRVAVIVAQKLFEWLSAKPELVTERLASLVLLDEAHHAQSGPYRQICEQIHFLRDRIVPSTNAPLHVLDESARQERLRDIGKQCLSATLLAVELQRAAERERRGEAGAGGVLDVLLARYPKDMATPQLIGLSASPVVHFKNREREAVELLLVLRCRVVGVVEELADLRQHRPNPAFVALSYLPLYEERVLQVLLRKTIVHVYRRMLALIPETAARNKLAVLATASVVTPGFAALCDQFITDTAMTDRFKKGLCFPPGSALEHDVQVFLAGHAVAADGAAPDPTSARYGGGGSSSWASSTLPSLTAEAMRNACADFILHGVRFLKALSAVLIALQEQSFTAAFKSFCKDYSLEVLSSIQGGCGPVTSLVLYPVLRSVFFLVFRMQEEHAEPLSLPVADAATAAVGAGEASTPLPDESLRESSTHIQLLMRIFTELAAVAAVMANATADDAERHLRVLVFVETRDTATGLMRVLSQHCPAAFAVLRPDVLLGQKNSKGSGRAYMTRAEQTALLERFRAGEVQLVFATTVAEEGIDVPACHVVMRCDRHTELRNIVQGCGRLRRRNTVFISLSNLLNSHPRLGHVLGCIRASEALLDGLALRCRDDAWRLEFDELLTGREADAVFMPVSLRANPNEATRLSTQERTLLARQRHILLDLQRTHRTEVFCVHTREMGKEPGANVRVEVMMAIPVGETQRGRSFHFICGAATGGVVKAAQKAFVQFCQSAQEHGYLSAEGRVVPAAGTSAIGVAATSGWASELRAMNLQCSYARSASPCVVFLGPSMCLCSRKTWPVEVLRHFLPQQADVMWVYNDDYWMSRVEPQTVLREELAAAGAEQERFHVFTGAARDAGDSDEAWFGSVSEVGSQVCSSSCRAPSSSTQTHSRNSRGLSSSSGVCGAPQERAELLFLLSEARAQASSSCAGWDPVSAGASASAERRKAVSACDVTEERITTASTDKSGKTQPTAMRRIRIRYTGPFAQKVVAVEGLLRLGVQVVYNVDEEALLMALRTCQQVSCLDE